MGLFGKKERIKGSIGYFGLQDWWLSAFTEEERQYIDERFQPLGSSGNSLTSGDISHTTETAVGLLYALAGWFSKENERTIAYKILEKAETLLNHETRILDVHFLYGQKIKILYKDRKKPGYMERAIGACEQQIEIAIEAANAFRKEYKESSLPGHQGYEQLAIILEKQKNFEAAIELCARADKEGWAGSWQKRIERCKTKLENAEEGK